MLHYVLIHSAFYDFLGPDQNQNQYHSWNAGMPGTYKISTNFAIINATTLHNYEYVISD
jgi:hypothetical protein